MRNLISITIILTIAACNLRPNPKGMVTEDLKYSAFYWGYNDETGKREFYLDHYINIKKNGTYVLMRHDDRITKPIYSNGNLDSSILNLIDTVFLNSKYKSDYSIDLNRPVVYHGLTYCFDYSIGGEKNKEIQFIPPYGPAKLNLLGSMLDTLISKAIKTNIDTLFLENYKRRMSDISFPNQTPLPLPPPPMNKNEKRFNPSDFKQ
jgi:hypothetical protein